MQQIPVIMFFTFHRLIKSFKPSMIIKRLKISEEFPRFLCTFTPDTLDRRVNSTACVLTFRSCLYSDKEQAVEIFKVIFFMITPFNQCTVDGFKIW